MIQRIYKIKGTEKSFWMNDDGGMSFSIEGNVTHLGHEETKQVLSALTMEVERFAEEERQRKKWYNRIKNPFK